MFRALCITSLIVLATLTNVRALQEQEIDSGPSDLSTDIKVLQKNITDLWNYIYELRNAMSDHLLHLKQHQIEIATVLHDLTHHSGGDHHHGTAGGESHGHMEDHSHNHGSSHEHSDDHHHHDDHHQEDSHHHHHEESSNSHSHDDGHHEQNKDDDHHHHDSNDDHHHHHESSDENHHHHEESNEKHDSKEHQQMHQHQQEEVAEKVIVATNVTRHNHHHHHHGMDPLNILDNYHGHGRSFSRTARNMTYIPRISESDLYHFAICDVKPNTAIASELQQDVRGQVSFWQNKQGGTLGIHVRLSGFQMGGHDHHQQQQQHHHHSGMDDGSAQDTENTVSHKHGFHIHELGDLSNSCQSTGPHYVTKSTNHGGPNSPARHVGDLGNIECDHNGNTNIVFSDRMASLTGPYSIIGRSLVIHANKDDLGINSEDPESLRTGNAGTRIACCIIQRVDRLPIRAQKSLKLAKQYKN